MGRKTKRFAAGEKSGNAVAQRAKTTASAAAYGRRDAVLFALTLFLSAALLFTVQPMFAKMVLPRLGGAPAVWNSCLVFYQAALLGGYLYAHLSLKWLGARRQALLHLAILALAWISLPIRIAGDWLPPATAFPTPWLWCLLAVSLGLPFLAVSASAPMLQAWFARLGKKTPDGESDAHTTQRDPYFLYAASNLGSLLGLLGYPLVIEANLTLAGQSLAWAIGFGLLMALVAACATMLWKTPGRAAMQAANIARQVENPPHDEKLGIRRRLHWLALSLVPSSLLMGVTTYVSSEVAQWPFLWVLPLTFYLLTFVVVFAPTRDNRKSSLTGNGPTGSTQKWRLFPFPWVRLQAMLVVVAAMSFLGSAAGIREMLLLGSLHLATFFATAMVCHGQLAADRPKPERLTEFYLWMSLGGVLGGLFSALAAPLIFNRALEYPLMLAAGCLLRPREGGRRRWQDALPVTAVFLCLLVVAGLRWSSLFSVWNVTVGPVLRVVVLVVAAFNAFLLRRRPAMFATAVGALAAISLWSAEIGTDIVETSRSFFGVLRIDRDSIWNRHELLNGTTIHGQQWLDENHRREPQGYYHRAGPLGRVFAELQPRRPLAEIGVLGLGVGTIAAYAEPGERFTFYEIDPEVKRIALDERYFTYLHDCRGTHEEVLGDARLSLEHGPPRQFDLLIADVFSSDAVPVHLMTREALKIYVDRLRPGGLLAFHISSRYLDLEPILGRLAAAESPPLAARIWRDLEPTGPVGRTVSVWVVMARSENDLKGLAGDPVWRPLRCDTGPAWTDDFSNVLGAMKWKTRGIHIMVPGSLTKASNAVEHGLRAQTLLAEERLNEAIEHYRKSLELDDTDAANHFGLASALAARGKTEEAADEYAEALLRQESFPTAHCGLGVAFGKMGKLDQAIREFRRAVELDPKYAEACCNLGNILLERKEFAEAMKFYQQGLAGKPDSAELHYGLGRVLTLQGKVVPHALSEFRRALPLAEQANNAALAEKIKAEIGRCQAWPWEKK